MPQETVPADIAAAMDTWMDAHHDLLKVNPHSTAYVACLAARAKARDALDAAILHHLRNADAMKAALERIEQGV